MLFAGTFLLIYLGNDVLLDIVRNLRYKDRGRADGNTGLQGNIAAASAHDLYNRTAVMRLSGIADLIDHIHRGIHRGIKADGIVGACDIIINRAGNADTGNAEI